MRNTILSIDTGGIGTGYFSRDLDTNEIHGGVIKTKNHLEKDKTITEIRRIKRGTRRIYARRRERNNKLLNLFLALGWIDSKDVLDTWKERVPVELRVKALNKKVSKNELAQIIYNYAQHRGYYGVKDEIVKERNKMNDEDKKSFIIDFIDEIDNRDITPAEFLLSKRNDKKRYKGIVFLHSQYETEFNRVWEKQQEFDHIKGMNNDIPLGKWNDIISEICHKKNSKKAKKRGLKFLIWEYIISYKRPLKSYRHLIKDCRFFPNKKTTLKCFEEFQEYRIWSQINNIKKLIKNTEICLSHSERLKLYQKFNSCEKITVKEICEILGVAKINFKTTNKFEGNKTRTNFLKLIPDWDILENDEKTEIINLVYNEQGENIKSVIDRINSIVVCKNIQITNADLKNIYLRLDQGSCEFSKKALNKIINPEIKKGISLYHIEKKNNTEQLDVNISSITNPSIKSKLSTIDYIIKQHKNKFGEYPTKVFIEVVAESNNIDIKRKIEKIQTLRRNENESIKDILIQNGILANTNNVKKYKLWKDCNEQCPYTGESITFDDIFKFRKYDIEHIITCYTNVFENLTISSVEFNSKKGNNTPYELYTKNIITKQEYNDILKRVLKFKSVNNDLTHTKYKYFSDQITVNDLRNSDLLLYRYLSDTSYTARIYKKYVESKYKIKVQTVKPKITKSIRDSLGISKITYNTFLSVMNSYKCSSILNGISTTDKNRLDNRHHLIDAICLSFSTPSIMYNIYKNSDNNSFNSILWNNWKVDVRDLVESVIVYHKIKNRKRGGLHEDTFKKLKYYDENGIIKKKFENYKPEGKKQKLAKKVLKIDNEGNKLAENSNNYSAIVYLDGGIKKCDMITLFDVVKNKKDATYTNYIEKFEINNYYLLDSIEYKFSTMSKNEIDNLPKTILSENIFRLFKISKCLGSFVHHILNRTSLDDKKNLKDNGKPPNITIHMANRKLIDITGWKISLKNGIEVVKAIK